MTSVRCAARCRAHSARPVVLACAAAFAAALGGCAPLPLTRAAPPAVAVDPAAGELMPELLAHANDARRRNGAGRLAEDAALNAAAADFARELAERRTLTHTSSRRGYATLLERLDRAGARVVRAGENVAALSGRAGMPEEVVRMWLASPGHRANLLNDGYTLTGAGAAFDGRDTWYFVQVYASPPVRR